jgi:non-canonical purine NTP pyrophosphatase (RdgB/HAM1 family)
MKIFLVTGNPNKVRELQALFPAEIALSAKKLDVHEIQSLDLHEIIKHKLHEAYSIVNAPVLVEDVSAELEKLKGLPGPFIKFFEQRLGKSVLFDLGSEGDKAKIICSMGYYDGKNEIFADGILHGTVTNPKGDFGWGFDYVFIPDGHDKTFAEMGVEAKNQISHRRLAALKLVEKLQKIM